MHPLIAMDSCTVVFATGNTPTISVLATAPYARLRVEAARQSDYHDCWSANFAHFQGASRLTVNFSMSVGVRRRAAKG